MAKLKALIVEDEPLVAEDIASCVELMGYEAAFIAYSGEEAIQFLKENNVDFALLDITLSGDVDGIEVAKQFRETQRAPFLFLTSHSDHTTLERAKATRPSGYLVKPFDENDLKTSLEVAIFNHFHPDDYGHSFSLEILNQRLPNPLSEKEFDVVSELRLGKTNKEIAQSLFVSVNTIKTHLNRLYAKLDASSRTELLFRVDSLLRSQ